ncbi:MAG: FHA domain-containing protein [Acidiferrobacterales bacterium]|nr:FHA domain-containing protein [Acidiferrobacterales bacterium]
MNSPSFVGQDYLRDYHTFGRRKSSVDTRLDFPYISKMHAIIEWREPNWLLKDVSKNGLKLNGKIVPMQKAIVLNVGDEIDFAGVGETVLKIMSLDPPCPMMINVEQPANTIEITENILLPSENEPELALYLCEERHQWFTESINTGEEFGPYKHGDLLSFGNSEWRMMLVSEDDATTEFESEATTLDDITFRFDLSQDEESTHLTLIDKGVEIDLGERTHNYLLVHLLRHRLDSGGDSGWLDSQLLMRELGLEESHMNIQIFRARKQIRGALNVSGGSRLIERRRGALRVGINSFEIYKEGSREA